MTRPTVGILLAMLMWAGAPSDARAEWDIVPRGTVPERTLYCDVNESQVVRQGRPSDDFNADYIFAVTRDVAGSRLHRWVVLVLAPVTVAADVALLPCALVLGIVDPR